MHTRTALGRGRAAGCGVLRAHSLRPLACCALPCPALCCRTHLAHGPPAHPLAPLPLNRQDENRHGDFLTAVLKARPELLNGLEARLWSRFFCLSVYITMYLNDHARHYFYEVGFGGRVGEGWAAKGTPNGLRLPSRALPAHDANCCACLLPLLSLRRLWA